MPDLQQQLAQMQMQAHEQGHQLGYAEGQKIGVEEGRKTGFQQGLEQGLAEAKQQQAPVHARMQQLVSEFQYTLDVLDSVIASRLMQMALGETARQVIGETKGIDNTALIKQIQSPIAAEPLFSGKPQLRVHPDDLQRVEEMLGATLSLHGWRLRVATQVCIRAAAKSPLMKAISTQALQRAGKKLCRLAAPECCDDCTSDSLAQFARYF